MVEAEPSIDQPPWKCENSRLVASPILDTHASFMLDRLRLTGCLVGLCAMPNIMPVSQHETQNISIPVARSHSPVRPNQGGKWEKKPSFRLLHIASLRLATCAAARRLGRCFAVQRSSPPDPCSVHCFAQKHMESAHPKQRSLLPNRGALCANKMHLHHCGSNFCAAQVVVQLVRTLAKK